MTFGLTVPNTLLDDFTTVWKMAGAPSIGVLLLWFLSEIKASIKEKPKNVQR